MTLFLFPDLPPTASPATIGDTRLSADEMATRGAGQSPYAKDELNRYDTIDPRAVKALLPHLAPRTRYVEPCAGKGDLVRQLKAAGHICTDAFDIAPRGPGIRQEDAGSWRNPGDRWSTTLITNPPFDWHMLRPLLDNWAEQACLIWILLEASFMHKSRDGRAEQMQRCRKIVTIGRLKWAVGSDDSSVKDYAWYQFGPTAIPGGTADFYSKGWKGRAL